MLKLFVERARPRRRWAPRFLLSHGPQLVAPRVVSHPAISWSPRRLRPHPPRRCPSCADRSVVYVAAIAFTRVLFGAHFPLDVLVGAALGYELGLFSVSLVANARLLPKLSTGTMIYRKQPTMEMNG